MFIYRDEVEKIEDNRIFWDQPLHFLTTKNGTVYVGWDEPIEKARWWGNFDSISEAKIALVNNRINFDNYKRVVDR